MQLLKKTHGVMQASSWLPLDRAAEVVSIVSTCRACWLTSLRVAQPNTHTYHTPWEPNLLMACIFRSVCKSCRGTASCMGPDGGGASRAAKGSGESGRSWHFLIAWNGACHIHRDYCISVYCGWKEEEEEHSNTKQTRKLSVHVKGNLLY